MERHPTGKWDTSVGGHVDLGESVEMALKREAGEELGISDFTSQLLTHYVFESDREKNWYFRTRPYSTDLSRPVKNWQEDVSGHWMKSGKI